MAKAEKTTVTREVTTTVEDDVVVLTLTPDELELVRALVGGLLAQGAYEAASRSVWDAIRDVDIPRRWTTRGGISLVAYPDFF